MPCVIARIKIAAPPAVVRAKFFEFDKIPEYAPGGFLVSIASAEGKAPSELVKGDPMNCVVGGGSMKLTPRIVENSPEAFIWGDRLPLSLLVASHAFKFSEAEDGKSTLFEQEEKWEGLFGSALLGENFFAGLVGMRARTQVGFEGFNRDFKAWVEKK